jgi:hypothetical protein
VKIFTTWKEDFYNAVKDYINRNYNVGAVEVTDVYDTAYASDNSLGYSDVDYMVDITYNTAERNGNLFEYRGRFASLIEEIT